MNFLLLRLLAALCRDVDAPTPTPGKRGRKPGFKLVRDNGAESAKKVCVYV